jgi:hypothetical protein
VTILIYLSVLNLDDIGLKPHNQLLLEVLDGEVLFLLELYRSLVFFD